MSNNELKKIYRTVFQTPAGRLVLEDMLKDLHVLDKYVSEEANDLENYGRYLLQKLGILDNTPKNILNKLLELDPVMEDENAD